MTTLSKQDQLNAALKQVNAQLELITKASNKPMITTGIFKYHEDSKKEYNVHEEKRIPLLIAIYGHIEAKHDQYMSAQEKFNLKSVNEFTYCKYTLDAWKNDIGTRIAILSSEQQRNNLMEWKKKIEGLLDKETQITNLLDNFNIEITNGLSLESPDKTKKENSGNTDK